jgi:hypothetical protein
MKSALGVEKNGFKILRILIFLIMAGSPPVFAGSGPQNAGEGFRLDLSEKYQPDFKTPRRYDRAEMKALALEVLFKIQRKTGQSFNRRDPQHVMALAEFFGLTPHRELDLYSMPMDEPDVRYFSEVDTYRNQEFYPISGEELIVRFYWEALARLSAAYYKLEIVNRKNAPYPLKTRGKVSDIATTAMFNKRPGMSVADAVAFDRDQYDFRRLISDLKLKGLPSY